jgi:lipopolysaccharide biosynthesis protein
LKGTPTASSSEHDLNESARARLIAFYLPQFHPIPENDAWWGKGFTEWRKVVQGKPLFKGHYQPRLPGELGYYDLRAGETREQQAELARAYGIHGFCYYHYWFNGRQLLERPFREVLESGRPDFPFCLCWANESWTRAWDGRTGESLIEQKYSREDDRAHLRWLASAFRDARYIRVHGKPLFLVYRVCDMPDPRTTAEVWREEAHKLGIGELFLCRVESNFEDERGDPRALGFDAAVEFQPDALALGTPEQRTRSWERRRKLRLASPAFASNHIWDYGEVAKTMLAKRQPDYPHFPGIMTGFDSSPRRKERAHIFRNSLPELYREWLHTLVARAQRLPPEERIIFVNAWNEWAEGANLEPDAKFGRAYLEATHSALG